MKDFVIFG